MFPLVYWSSKKAAASQNVRVFSVQMEIKAMAKLRMWRCAVLQDAAEGIVLLQAGDAIPQFVWLEYVSVKDKLRWPWWD